jgi:hypothetical protein
MMIPRPVLTNEVWVLGFSASVPRFPPRKKRYDTCGNKRWALGRNRSSATTGTEFSSMTDLGLSP